MSDFTRARGDNYPFIFKITINGKAIDISADTLSFSYKNENETLKTIIGNPLTDGADGNVKFIPRKGVDFMISGVFDYDIQRISNGYTYTHDKGKLILYGDVTP